MKTTSANLFVTAMLALSALPAGAKTHVAGPWALCIDNNGATTILHNSDTIAPGSVAQWGVDNDRRSFSSLKNISSKESALSDKFGKGKLVTLSGEKDGVKVTQYFYMYPERDYLLTDFTVSDRNGTALNYMAPIWTAIPFDAFDRAGNSTVFIPFDNDAWVRYRITPFGEEAPESYEVSAMLNADTRRGIILGSVEHDTWKTGIKNHTSGSNRVDSLAVYGGAWSNLTRDIRPHGKVKGKSVKSPKVMVGVFDDWRDGMETFGDLCSIQAPKIAARGARPFGWNSWGKLQTKITYDKAMEVSDFFAKNLQPNGYANADGTVYIGLDAFWDFGFKPEEHKKFVEHCRANGQKAGIYYCPFTDWGKDPEATVGEMPQYKFKDLYLMSGDKILEFDGAYALDPTHPATKARIARQMKEFIDWGYEYVKIDFMAHGTYESDRHFNPDVTTGIQAYNEGMAFIDSVADGKLWINLSIAPVLPGNFAHSRRIGCDAWADINNTEYTLNSLTYGWWLDHVYHNNDADHIVLENVTDGENRARVTSSALTGVYLLGDDMSLEGDEATKQRIIRNVTNNDINEMARRCHSFRPIEPGEGDRAANAFVAEDGDNIYVAVFNFSDQPMTNTIPLRRIGLSEGQDYTTTELWSHDNMNLHGKLSAQVPSKDVKVYRIKR
jgi:alpha-galactosidase